MSRGHGSERRPDPVWDELRGIDEELRFHIEGRVESLMARGLSESEARTRALAAFGDVDRVREEMRRIERDRARRRRWSDGFRGLWLDVRVGARRLARTPAVSVAAVLTLALGIGATVAVFSVLNAVVLRPLPYPDPDRLVEIMKGSTINLALSRELSRAIPSVESFSGISRWQLTLTGEGEARTVAAEVVDAGYFDVVGVRPALGRAFTMEETEPAASDVVVLSHALWRTRFGSDPGVLGQRVELDGYSHARLEVIGVMPPGFRSLGASPDGRPLEPADAWVPLELATGRTAVTDSSWWVTQIVARVQPDVPPERVAAETRAAAMRIREAYPFLLSERAAQSASAVRLIDGLVSGVRSRLWMMLGAVGLVLLMACANLANLQLARLARRRSDLAVRVALGAGRGRIVREQLIEGGLLAAAGGAIGILLATASLAAMRVAESYGLPRVHSVTVDAGVLLFAAAVTVLSLLLFAVLPALRSAPRARHDVMRATGGGGLHGRGSHRVSRALVVFEMALSMMLVSAAVLMLTSFVALRSVDPGMDVDDVLMVRVHPPPTRYADEQGIQLYDEIESRIGALPGVMGVGAIQLEPFTGGNWAFPYRADGHAFPAGAPLPSANFRVVTSGYFEAVDVPLLAGRGFEDGDLASAPQVMVLNEALAELAWPGEDPIGREIHVFGDIPFRVVGVVGDVRQHALDRDPSPEMYVPYAQWDVAAMAVMVEAATPTQLTAAIRSVIRDIDPDVAIAQTRPLTALLGESLARRRFFAALLGTFGVLALVLGAVGVYGVMSHQVGTMLRVAGVRLALGATPSSVVRTTVWSGVLPAATGLVIGVAGAMASAGLLQGLLYGIAPIDPRTYVGVGAVLAAVALLATWLPARRLAKLDPLTVLRTD